MYTETVELARDFRRGLTSWIKELGELRPRDPGLSGWSVADVMKILFWTRSGFTRERRTLLGCVSMATSQI
jgi:hypothetical protein